jgi:formylglycine-generating enzyme required for sulfatase activity
VVRGGGWNNNPRNLRSANRNRNNPDEANNNVGFRLARPPDPTAGAGRSTD